MNLFYKRHLALFCTIFAVVSIGGCFLISEHKIVLGLSLLIVAFILGVLSILLKKPGPMLLKCSLCLLFAVLALADAYLSIDRKRDKLAPFFEQSVETEITVIGKNSTSDFLSFYDVSVALDGKSYGALLICDYKGDFSVGDILFGEVTVIPIEDSQEISTYYLSKGVYLSVHSSEDSLEVVERNYSNFKIRMRSLNTSLSRIFEYKIGGNASDLISAISLGNKSLLDNDVLRDFRRTGLSHVLAISGMHLSVIMTALEWLFRRFGIRKSFRCVSVFLIAFFYLALTGFSLSTVRAFIMMTFVYLAFLLRDDNDAVTSLFVSLFLILAISPNAVWDIGLWMSFLAVLGILIANYFIGKISQRLYETAWKKTVIRIAVYLLSAVLITLFANVFVCFPMWLYFGELSLISVLSNLLVSPLISLILFIAPLLLLSHFVPLLSVTASGIADILGIIGDLVLNLTAWMSNWENITVSLRYPFAGYIIVPSFFLLLLTLILPLRRKFWIPLIPAVAAIVFCGCFLLHNLQNADTLTVDYLSFGESEMLVMTTAEDAVICDLSTGGSSHLYQSILTAEKRFATEISALILTHYHTYHISTFSKNAASSIIRTLYLPMPQNLDEYHLMNSLIDTAEKANVRVVLYDRGKAFSPAEEITVNLSPLTYLKRSTHPTFVLSVSAYGESLTYVAESAHDDETLRSTVNEHISASDYIILGTHGPITKTDFHYESNASSYFFVSDSNVFSHFDPPKNANIVVGSSKICIRFEKEKAAQPS